METEERGRRRALFIGTALEGGHLNLLREHQEDLELCAESKAKSVLLLLLLPVLAIIMENVTAKYAAG
ncbi:unnamed protein product [Cyprideis torosa]|uniref:Uncharacterized protein n=1 Tax=Cyprideis torosa TaxID=163714 RepID=A0A7R8WN41_9CRUS|nr:unnamed protein product [Cyprideis torosa]CAG0900165.1 unnamed protein product [Cyprideis torosa]